jgi:hypothetical protein
MHMVAKAVLLLASGGLLAAATAKLVHIPLTFHAESKPIVTTTCLGVLERAYPANQTGEWTTFGPQSDAAERTLESTIAAFRAKSKEVLARLTDGPSLPASEFDKQAAIFFSQFDRLQLLDIPRAYELEDFVVFFGIFRLNAKVTPATLIVRTSPQPRFLLKRSQAASIELVTDWFGREWIGNGSSNLQYCSATALAGLTQRLPLPQVRTRAPEIHFRGVPGSASAQTAMEAKAALNGITKAVSATNVKLLLPFMAPEGARRLSEWYETASNDEKAVYLNSLAGLEPIALVDAGALQVIYVQKDKNPVQVMYFVKDAGGSFRWTNSSHVTVSDLIYKNKVMLDSATNKVPFESLRIK